MSLKKLFWNAGGDEGGNTDKTQPETPTDRTTVARPTRPAASPPLTSPLAALRQGPSASIFTKTTGLSTVAAAIAPSTPAHSVDSEFDHVIAETLDQDAKAPGYREFMAQYAALSRVILDPKQCVAAVLAAVLATNPNLNSTVIARAFGERLKLLSDYNASYEADSRKSEQGENSDKNAAITEIDSRLREIESEIGRLTGERTQCESQRETLQRELAGVTQKYDGYRARFAGTVEARRAELRRMMKLVAPGAAEEKEN